MTWSVHSTALVAACAVQVAVLLLFFRFFRLPPESSQSPREPGGSKAMPTLLLWTLVPLLMLGALVAWSLPGSSWPHHGY